MKIRHKLRLAAALAVVGAVFAAVQIDLMPYRKATRELEQNARIYGAFDMEEKTASDLQLFVNCSGKDKLPQSESQQTDYRTCLLDALPRLESEVGAEFFVLAAAHWIEAHPEDAAIKKAAAAALETGWNKFRRNMPYYQMNDTVAAAHDKSILLRALNGSRSKTPMSMDRNERMDRAELSLFAPDLMKKLAERHLSLIQ